MAKIASLLILILGVSAFTWTVSPDGLTQIAGEVDFNPYERPAYVVVADLAGAPVQIGLVAADLEVVSARCIAGLVCAVTWQAQLKLPCGSYALLAVLRQGDEEPSDTLELGQHRLGCEMQEQFLPLVSGGGS